MYEGDRYIYIVNSFISQTIKCVGRVIINQITIWRIDWYRFFNNFPENSNLLKNFDVKNLMKIYYNFSKTHTPTHLQIHQLSLQLCICGYQQETKIDLRALMCTCYIAVIVLFFSLMFVQIFFFFRHFTNVKFHPSLCCLVPCFL